MTTIQLMAYGMQDIAVRPELPLWPVDTRLSSSQIVEQSVDAPIERCSDLVRDVWYVVTLHDVPDDVYGLIESVEFTIGGQVIERYSGFALKMLATFDKKAVASVMSGETPDGITVAIPLRLCTSDDTAYLPLICLAYQEVVVRVTPSAGHNALKHSLFVDHIMLGTDVHTRIRDVERDMRVTAKHSLSYTVDALLDTPNRIVVPLVAPALRDLVIFVRPMHKPDTRIDHGDIDYATPRDAVLLMLLERIDNLEARLAPKPLVSPLISLGVSLAVTRRDGTVHEETVPFNVMMAQHAVPRQCYGIESNPHPMYYVPFDLFPYGVSPTTTLNVHQVGIEMRMQPGRYEVHVLARTKRVYKIAAGIAVPT